jgi:hypothetical protein
VYDPVAPGFSTDAGAWRWAISPWRISHERIAVRARSCMGGLLLSFWFGSGCNDHVLMLGAYPEPGESGGDRGRTNTVTTYSSSSGGNPNVSGSGGTGGANVSGGTNASSSDSLGGASGTGGTLGCTSSTLCLTPCYTWDSSDCGSDEFCDFLDRSCGKAAGTTPSVGRCLSRPKATDCPVACDPICACDGTIYCTECHAHVAGSDGTPSAVCGS